MTTSSRQPTEVELASERLRDILARARKLDVANDQLLDLRAVKKLIARTSGLLGGRCAVRLGLLCLLIAGLYVYTRWPTIRLDHHHDQADTVRTVLRRTCATGDIADRVAAALLRSSSSSAAQDDSC